MKLTTAGELLLRWVKNQDADLQRVMSQIAELRGMQRGEVTIACSQAAQIFLAREISSFRQRYPLIKFTVKVTDPPAALQQLSNFECDLVLIFMPFISADLQIVRSIEQRVVAVMAHDHPLAAQPSVRLSECGSYDVALSSPALGGREWLERVLIAASGRLSVMFDGNAFVMLPSIVRNSHVIGFNLEIGTLDWAADPLLAIRPISDIPRSNGPITLGQLKGRTLLIAGAKFAEHLRGALESLTPAI